jgi:hypothetical protein
MIESDRQAQHGATLIMETPPLLLGEAGDGYSQNRGVLFFASPLEGQAGAPLSPTGVDFEGNVETGAPALHPSAPMVRAKRSRGGFLRE